MRRAVLIFMTVLWMLGGSSVCFCMAQETEAAAEGSEDAAQTEADGEDGIPAWLFESSLSIPQAREKLKDCGEGRRDDELSAVIWDSVPIFDGISGELALFYMGDEVTGWTWKDADAKDRDAILGKLSDMYGEAAAEKDKLNDQNYMNTWRYQVEEEKRDIILTFQERCVSGELSLILSAETERAGGVS